MGEEDFLSWLEKGVALGEIWLMGDITAIRVAKRLFPSQWPTPTVAGSLGVTQDRCSGTYPVLGPKRALR